MKEKGVFSFSNLLLALLSSLFFLALNFLPAFDLVERRFLDLSFRIRGAEPPHPDLVIVEIDDASVRRIGTWPWPRSFHAALLKVLADSKPSVVFYDVIFSEESEKGEDETFAQEIKKADNVILPLYFADNEPVYPIPAFRENAKALGYVNVEPDRDGHLREIVLTRSVREKTFLHVSLASASLHQGYETREIERFLVPQGTLINFPGPYANFQRVPFDQLIESHETPGAEPLLKSLQGKAVLVGLTAAGTGMDLKPTAFSPLYPGVGVQASMLHTLLSGKFIQKLPLPFQGGLLFLFALLILGLSLYAPPFRSVFYAAGSLAAIFVLVQLAFQRGIWVPYFGFLALGSVLFAGTKFVEFVRIRLEREILSRELALASRIQRSFLPETIPTIPGLEVAAVSLPARQVGGDLYDILPIGNGQWGLCVGDVSGKGIPAALFMAKALSEFRREADPEPRAVLERLNAKLAHESTAGIFLTLLYVVVEPDTRRFFFSSGGHEPILHYRKDRGTVELISTQKGLPLGVLGDAVFDQQERNGETGDLLLLLSDGVKEAMNPRKEMFGTERVSALLRNSASLPPHAIIGRLLEEIRKFVKNAPPHDDLTLICAKFL